MRVGNSDHSRAAGGAHDYSNKYYDVVIAFFHPYLSIGEGWLFSHFYHSFYYITF